MAKNIVISGYYGFKNFGDEAILSVLIKKLKSYGANITVLSANPEWTKLTYEVESFQTFSLNSVLKSVRNADILISGGGSLLQDVTSIKSLIYYLMVIFIALIFKKKVIIFAQGIGPINNPFARVIAMQILKRCTYITVRDSQSLEFLKQYGISSELVCDPIHSVPIPDCTKEHFIGIQLRGFKTMNIDFINHLAMHVVRNFPGYYIRVLSLQKELDLKVCKLFVKAVKVIAPDANIEVAADKTNEEIIQELSRLEYLIAMRFHALLIGLKAGVKSLGINYDIKVEKLANETGIPFISLTDFSDFNEKFSALKTENSEQIKQFSNSKVFNWEGIEKNIV